MPAHRNGGFRFYHWLSASLALHSGIVLPFLLINLHSPALHKSSRLQIELFGMVSDRQTEAKIQQHAPPRAQQPRQVSTPDAYKTVARESTVLVKNTEDKHKPTDQTNQPIQSTQASDEPVSGAMAGASSSGNAAIQQRQQTIRTALDQETEKRRYAARLVKQVRSNLVYPQEMRKSGVEAVSRIMFIVTKSGDILGDSLRILKSSGYAALDSSALRSARISAPFEKPPKDNFKLSFDVAFTINMARPRAN